MIYVFNKNKIISYIIATCFVLMLFSFSFKTDTMPVNNVELLKVSSNVVEDKNNQTGNIN